MCVCLAVRNGSGKFGGWDYSSERDIRPHYTLYCMCALTSGRTRAAAAEEDAVEEQQLKQTQ